MLTDVKGLVETAAAVEKLRIGLSNRMSALERGVDTANRPVPEVYADLMRQADGMEKAIDSAIAQSIKGSGHPAYPWLSRVRGIGPHLAAQMLSFLLPPLPDSSVGTWFKAAGLVAEYQADQGQWRLPRARKGGGKTTHHRYLRRCLYNVGTSLVRTGRFYRAFYERVKARLQGLHAGDEAWPPFRVDRVARWVTVKLLLSHLWEVWADAEDIDVRVPYAIGVLGHDGYIPVPQAEGKAKI